MRRLDYIYTWTAGWKRGLRHTAGFAGLMGFALPTIALAQAPPPVPTREEIQRVQPLPTLAPNEQIVTADDKIIERAPCPLANAEFANVKLTLRGVEFSPVEGIDPGLLAPAYTDRIGQEVPVSVVCDIRDRAATILRANGFLAAVRVPPQTISDGVIRLDILAARLARVEVRGDAGRSEGLLQRYLDKLQGQPVFNIIAAERYLLLAREIPGLDARLALRPGVAPGEVVGEVTVTRTNVRFDANIQNFGTRDVGRFGGIARVRVAGLTGLGDLTTASIYSTADFQEQQVVQAAHEFRLGSEGLTLGGNFAFAWTRPDITGLDISSHTLIGNIYAQYPLVLRQAHRLMLSGGLDIIDQNIFLGGVPINRDKLRILNLRADASWTDPASVAGRGGYSPSEPRWFLGGSIELRKGLKILGASDDCGPLGAACFAPGAIPLTRIEGDPTAFLVRANGQFEWRPTKSVTLAVAPRAQWSADPLLSYEEFSAGNFTVGRGYDAGTIIGDSGVGVALEARAGSLIPQERRDLAVQPFVFFDAAWVWNKDAAFAGLNPQRLYSAGGGLRLALGDLARLDMALAVPLKRAGFQTQRGDARFLMSLTTQFGIRAK